MTRSTMGVVLLLIAAVAVVYWLTTARALPAPLATSGSTMDPGRVESILAAGEAAVPDLIPGAEKRIRWAGKKGTKTPYAVVYFHGFSATRQEIAPVPERVADALGANLFETRLSGHGLAANALESTRAEQWLADGAEALAVGRALGEQLVVVGTSTGATLAAAFGQHPDFAAVDSLVMLSPNFGPASAGSSLPSGPFGKLISRMILGEYRQWEAANEAQGRYWSTRYPTSAIVEMSRLVDLARSTAPGISVPRALLIYSPDDQVVSVEKSRQGFAAIKAVVKDQIAIQSGGGPSRHVLAGDILAPENTDLVVARICSFIADGRCPETAHSGD